MEGITRTEVPPDLAPSAGVPMATDKQLDYLSSLAVERDISEEARTELLRRIEAKDIAKRRASEFISRLLEKPKLAQSLPRVGQWAPGEMCGTDEAWAMRKGSLIVPRGSYAIATDKLPGEAVNQTNFYSVWINKVDDEVRWSVKQRISDDLIKLPRARQYDVLNVISTDPGGAAAAYGHLIGKCGICGRGLTNDESRERGIGPVCAERWGW